MTHGPTACGHRRAKTTPAICTWQPTPLVCAPSALSALSPHYYCTCSASSSSFDSDAVQQQHICVRRAGCATRLVIIISWKIHNRFRFFLVLNKRSVPLFFFLILLFPPSGFLTLTSIRTSCWTRVPRTGRADRAIRNARFFFGPLDFFFFLCYVCT